MLPQSLAPSSLAESLPGLLPQSPIEYALWVGLIVVGLAIGCFGSRFEGKWRRRFNEERRFYAQYRDETDRLNIEKTRRLAELEAQKNALSQEVVRLRGDAAALAARVEPIAPAPVAALAPPEMLAEHPVETPAEPAAEIIEAQHAEPAVETVEPLTEAAPATPEPAPHPAPEPAAEPLEEHPAALPIMAAAAAPMAMAAITHPDVLPHIETEREGDVTTHAAAETPLVMDTPVDEPPPVAAQAAEPAHPEPVAPPFIEPEAQAETPEPIQIDAALNGLTRIRGIDATLAAGLGSLGVRQIEDIERLSAEDEKAIEIQLNLPPGMIANQQWRLQAALIGSGEDGLIGA